jgi:hypothetical protein
MTNRMAVVALGLWVAGTGGARAEDPEPGSRVRIRLDREAGRKRGGREVTGKLIEAGTERLVVALARDRRVEVSRATIERVDVSRGRSRGKGALKGFAIGAGLGLTFFGPARAVCRDDGFLACVGEDAGLYLGTPLLGAIGAGIGAIRGAEQWRTVEHSRGPRVAVAPLLAGGGVGVRLTLSF